MRRVVAFLSPVPPAASPSLLVVAVGVLVLQAFGGSDAAAAGLHRDGFVRSRDANTNVCLFWTTRDIPWHLNEKADAADATFEEVEQAILRSFATWQSVSCSDLSFSYEGRTPVTAIGFRQGAGNNLNLLIFRTRLCRDVVPDDDACWQTPGACANTFDCWSHPSGVIALTTTNYNTANGVILDSDIEFNSAGMHFTTRNGPPCQRQSDQNCVAFDVENTATHEIGHLIGLDHSPDREATMFAQAELGEASKRNLAQDDIDAICHVYPENEAPRTCTPSGKILVTPTGRGDDGNCNQAGTASIAGALVLLLGMSHRIRRKIDG